MRAFLLALVVLSALPTSAVAQNESDIDVATFIKDTTQAGTLIQDPNAPVSFRLAPGWTLNRGIRWGDHENTLWFVDNQTGVTVALYYQSPLQPPYPADAATALREGMEAKVRQRQREGISDYHVRPDSIQSRKIGGQPALGFIAEFDNQGQTRAEYMVRVMGKSVKAHFFVMGIPASTDIIEFTQHLEPMVTSLQIP